MTAKRKPTNVRDVVDYQQIAAKAGVSRMTVSRALRNAPEISERTRLKVIRIAEELGYTPNPLLSAWMSGVRARGKQTFEPVLYYVIEGRDAKKSLRVAQFRRYFPFAKARAAELGFRLETMTISDTTDSKRVNEILRARNCPGVMIAPFHDTATSELEMRWNDFSSVTIGYSLINPDLHRVCLNHSQGMATMLTGFLERKVGRIGLVVRRFSDERVRHLPMQAYLGFRFRHPKEDILEPLFVDELDRPTFSRWFKRHQPNILIASESLALDCIDELDHRPPGERCRMVHPDEDYATDPRIYGALRSNSNLIGKAAAELLITLVRNNERGLPSTPQTILIPTEFAERRHLSPK